MKKAWLSALLNFFFSGLGYVYNGKRILPGILLTLAAISFTFLENFYKFSDGLTFQKHDGTAFAILFASVFVLNTGLAIDAYKEAQQINKAS